VTRLLASWAGLRTFAPDRQLVLGPDPLDPAFLWCAGQGGYGFQSACAASRHLAETVAGASPTIGGDIASALSPGRFR
jgi:glycine/D-amino acid oxidase-like deaminating enzyme